MDIPIGSTDTELNVYKKMCIIRDEVCTKTWPEAPSESVRGELAETSAGTACVGI